MGRQVRLNTGDLFGPSAPNRPPAGARALGRLPAGVMNKTEAAYSTHLEYQRLTGAILWWRFDAIRLRVGKGVFYEPDFLVMTADGGLEIHEVKGRWEEDAKVKFKVVSGDFPFRFRLVRRLPKDGGWDIEDF